MGGGLEVWGVGYGGLGLGEGPGTTGSSYQG